MIHGLPIDSSRSATTRRVRASKGKGSERENNTECCIEGLDLTEHRGVLLAGSCFFVSFLLFVYVLFVLFDYFHFFVYFVYSLLVLFVLFLFVFIDMFCHFLCYYLFPLNTNKKHDGRTPSFCLLSFVVFF